MKSAPPRQGTSVVEVANVTPSGFWLLVEDWPTLDIDLAIESLDHPEKYPLVSRARPNSAYSRRRRGERASGHEYAGRAFAAEAPGVRREVI